MHFFAEVTRGSQTLHILEVNIAVAILVFKESEEAMAIEIVLDCRCRDIYIHFVVVAVVVAVRGMQNGLQPCDMSVILRTRRAVVRW